MKRSILLLLIFMTCASTVFAEVSEKPLFGPKTYDVKERYGRENRYQETFSAAEGVYLIKIQNGEKLPDRSEYIEFTVNDQKLLRDDRYGYPFIACVVKLRKENSFELVLKDSKPSGDKRPKLSARFAVLSVMPLSVKLPEGVYGVLSWNKLQDIAGLLREIKAPESFSLAAAALSLSNDSTARAEAVRKLSDRKDAQAQDYLAFLFSDDSLNAEVKGETALALGAMGDKASIPLLMNGLLDPEENIRIGSARALSFYREDDTRELFTKLLQKLDPMRMQALLRTISDAGWKPVGTFMTLAESSDPYVAHMGITLLGTAKNSSATAFLLKLLKEPGKSDPRVIITALGASRDPLAIEPLSRMAGAPSARAGLEVELAEALASLGDQKAAPLIEDMIKNASTQEIRSKLRGAYRKLTGKAYKN